MGNNGKKISSNKIKYNSEKVAFCRFRKLGNRYIVTNDVGRYVSLCEGDFKRFLEGNLPVDSEAYKLLEENNFIKGSLDKKDLPRKWRQRNVFLYTGSLHIVVVTLRCNLKCVYCQASSRGLQEKGYDMDLETAKKVVDTIFSTPNKAVTIEFQGGEPLANWPTVKFIVEYAREKNKKFKKDLFITLVSNLSLMSEDRYKFLDENKVSFCTSLDGPRNLHNKNRPWKGGDSYALVSSWIGKIRKKEKIKKNTFHISALLTVSRDSLKHPKEIIDTYLSFGFKGIHLRPLSFLGLSGSSKEGYSTEEFLDYWKKSIDYIIDLNLRGKYFSERGSLIMLKKILGDMDPGFLDLRSPCGAGIGQILYNYDGKVFTCDEGRMIGSDVFLIGNVNKNSYKEIVSHETVKSMCIASLLDNLPCDNCAYKPYCGVCPVLNYALYGDVFNVNNDQCKLHRGMLDYLFEKLENKKTEEILRGWVEENK